MPATQTTRRLILAARPAGAVEMKVFQGRDHLVVPVVMMVEGVVHAVNSPRPELALAEEFGRMPKAWDGRPVVGGHPTRHGEHISANDPVTLEQNAFGVLFNTKLKGDRLFSEAWIDPSKAVASGFIGESAIERIHSGEEILEVSVGVFCVSEDAEGIFAGKKFKGIWRDILPDHLAILAPGDRGACSVDMGCGAMRSAIHFVTAQGIELQRTMIMTKPVGKAGRLLERVGAFLKSFKDEVVDAADVSDREVFNLLDTALRAVEPGYLGVDEVFSADGFVVYAVMPADRFMLLRRSFTVGEDGSVALGDDAEEVQRVQSIEPVTVASAVTPKPSCGCDGHPSPTTAVPATAGEPIMNKTERIAALVASKKLGPAMTAKVLEAMPDDQIAAIEASVQATPEPEAPAPAPTPAPVVSAAAPPVVAPTAPVVAGASPATAEAYISAAPADMQDALREGLRMATEKRNGVIASLKASGRCDYSDAELAAMSTHGLERLAKLAAVPPPVQAPVDFAGIGMPRFNGSNDTIDPPPSLIDNIRAAAARK